MQPGVVVQVEPDKLRELAERIRRSGDAVGELAPVADDVSPVPTMTGSAFAGALEHTALAMDRVVAYHRDVLHEFAEQADQAAARYEQTDTGNALAFNEVGPL
ncbi:type VII secretion target [Rhodococcus sp. NPDC049939]|uniref:type VII secretion target n=1 Tax=Rhodococcus sp. NPDC049939 TaxID=3155511 RepID=UPI0033F1EEA4